MSALTAKRFVLILIIGVICVVTYYVYKSYNGFYNRTSEQSIDVVLEKIESLDNTVKIKMQNKWLRKPEYNPEGIDVIVIAYGKNINPVFPYKLNNAEQQEIIMQKFITVSKFNASNYNLGFIMIDKSKKNQDNHAVIEFIKSDKHIQPNDIKIYYMHGYAEPMGEMVFWVKEGVYKND